jgi:hypothetical protein
MDTKPWPYCEGHPDCHDSRTRRYASGGTVATGCYPPVAPVIYVILDYSTGSPAWGKRLCKAHALIKFGVA